MTLAAGLQWHARLDSALAEAKAKNRPVLLLSMFGHLDEEMACANARTLRATLFPSPEFQKLAKEEVVLAWEMVREVPKVTIDLGDGKPIRRTVRGNAVMYLLRPNGEAVDAFPGVYTAADFLPMVRQSIQALIPEGSKPEAIHMSALKQDYARITMGKAVVESPVLALLGARPTGGVRTPLEPGSSEARQGFLRMAQALEDFSLRPMGARMAVAEATGSAMEGKDPKEIAFAVLKADSQRNVTMVRPVVRAYFASLAKSPTPLEARDAVLETILKIPYKDPYFGLRDVVMPGTPW